MSNTVLETINLTKNIKIYCTRQRKHNNQKSDIYGLIGRNGAGKTTLMKVITTLTNKTSGEFKLFDSSDSELTESKRRIGCLIENPAFFPNMSAYKNLKYYAIQKRNYR